MKHQRITIARRLRALTCLASVLLSGMLMLSACGLMFVDQSPQPTLPPGPTSAATHDPLINAGCPPRMFLPSNSEVFIKGNSNVQIVKVADPTPGQSAVELSLAYGEIVVNSLLPWTKWVDVITPNGFVARLAGRSMVVAYAGEGAQLTLACVDGTCKIGPNISLLTDVPAGSQGVLDVNGNYVGPYPITLELLPQSCETILQGVPLTGTTPTPTFDAAFAGTATAACTLFHQQYPLTPTCP